MKMAQKNHVYLIKFCIEEETHDPVIVSLNIVTILKPDDLKNVFTRWLLEHFEPPNNEPSDIVQKIIDDSMRGDIE